MTSIAAGEPKPQATKVRTCFVSSRRSSRRLGVTYVDGQMMSLSTTQSTKLLGSHSFAKSAGHHQEPDGNDMTTKRPFVLISRS